MDDGGVFLRSTRDVLFHCAKIMLRSICKTHPVGRNFFRFYWPWTSFTVISEGMFILYAHHRWKHFGFLVGPLVMDQVRDNFWKHFHCLSPLQAKKFLTPFFKNCLAVGQVHKNIWKRRKIFLTYISHTGRRTVIIPSSRRLIVLGVVALPRWGRSYFTLTD